MAFYQKILDDRVLGMTGSEPAKAGWARVADFAALVRTARRQTLALHLRPGLYPSGPIDVNADRDLAGPLTLTAEVGTVTILLDRPAPYLFKASGVGSVDLSNIVFDGNHLALTEPSQAAGLIQFVGPDTQSFSLRNCTLKASTQAGIACAEGASGTIADNHILDCDTGMFCIDCAVVIERNRVTRCANNGIRLWTSALAFNGSRIAGNVIDTIANAAGGTGQYGNGISVFRAGGVAVTDNRIARCSYSAIRLNAASNGRVIANACQDIRECAIWFEAPGPGLDLDGGIAANNIITRAGGGVQVVNSGLYGDGTARHVTLVGNQISTITRTPLANEGGRTLGIGILVEGRCNVVANAVDNAASAGIVLGTNNGATDLTASGNFIHACPLGIGYSANPSAAGLLITGNLISGFAQASSPAEAHYPHSGAIVSVTYTGSDYQRDAPGGFANRDYGNAAPTTAGPLSLGLNTAR